MKNNKPNISSQQLVIDFQNVALSRLPARAAEEAAEQSENNVLSQLSSAGTSYLNPANIERSEGEYVARASIDAHIKKVQAEQLKSFTAIQLGRIIEKDKKDYIGRRVRIIASSKEYNPFDAIWYDAKNGIRSSEFKKKTIEGSIEALDFEKNLISIKPKVLSKFIYTNLQSFVVYVINPQTLLPAVEIYSI
jgi:hypothetical protein